MTYGVQTAFKPVTENQQKLKQDLLALMEKYLDKMEYQEILACTAQLTGSLGYTMSTIYPVSKGDIKEMISVNVEGGYQFAYECSLEAPTAGNA